MTKLTFEKEININIFCRCGASLEHQTEAVDESWRSKATLTIEPCQDCLNKAVDKALEENLYKARSRGI